MNSYQNLKVVDGFFDENSEDSIPELTLLNAIIVRAVNDLAAYAPRKDRRSAIFWFLSYVKHKENKDPFTFKYCSEHLNLSESTIQYLLKIACDAGKDYGFTYYQTKEESELETKRKPYREVCRRLVKGARLRVSKT